MEIFRRCRDRRGEAYTLVGLGALWRRTGNPDAAREAFASSAGVFGELGVRRGSILARRGLIALGAA
jgi:hypothetical protein